MTMAKPKYPYSMLINAKNCSMHNWGELSRSVSCGCYRCGTIFLSKDITQWIGLDKNNADNATAVCPFCGSESVIPKSSSYPLNKDFLDHMKKYWFKDDEHVSKPEL